MPSPFPGMDPYLEDTAIWPGVHDRLIIYLADALQPQLLPRYYIDVRERIYFEDVRDVIYPDATVHRNAMGVKRLGQISTSDEGRCEGRGKAD